mgnify:CR=1 FL=1
MIKKILKWVTVSFCSLLLIFGCLILISNITPVDVDMKIVELNSYCRMKGYNTNYGILVDYGKHSFKKRFFVVDLNNGDVVMKCLCSHGRGGESTILKGEFSNVPGSYCSSLGHYKIGRERYISYRQWLLNSMVWIRQTPMPDQGRSFCISHSAL